MLTVLHTERKVRDKKTPARPQILLLIERDGLGCHWCGRTCDPNLDPNADLYPTREHLIRKCDGGSSRMHNLVLACRKCNNTRHSPWFVPRKAKNHEAVLLSTELSPLTRFDQ